MTNLFGLKAQQETFEFIFYLNTRSMMKRAQVVHHFIKEAFASAFRLLPIARILFDMRFHAGIEDALAVVLAVKARVEM